MGNKGALVIGGLLIAGGLAGGLAYALTRPKEEEEEEEGPPVGPAEYRLAASEYLGPQSWYKPPNIDIAEGQPFAAKLSFQHRGASEMVQVCFRLNIQQAWQYVYSTWRTLPSEASWQDHTIETLQAAIDFKGLPACRGINGEVILMNPAGKYLLEIKNADIYHTIIPIAEYQLPVVVYWGS